MLDLLEGVFDGPHLVLQPAGDFLECMRHVGHLRIAAFLGAQAQVASQVFRLSEAHVRPSWEWLCRNFHSAREAAGTPFKKQAEE